jgi:hypothetical protein
MEAALDTYIGARFQERPAAELARWQFADDAHAVPIRFTNGESSLPLWLFWHSEPEPRPNNLQETEAQSTLIINRIRTYASLSPTPLVALMQQFYWGVEIVMHLATLIAQHNERLEANNAAASERKGRKRKRWR